MGNAESKSFYSLFPNSKPFGAMIFFVIIVCVLGYVVCAGYANGNNQAALSDEDGSEWQIVRMRVTAYCPCPKCCGKYSDGITACGHKIRRDDFFVAADSKYPFGTEMIIPGYKSTEAVKVLDRGGAICGNRLDVFFNSHQEALNWGVRYLDVKILRR